jgi:hypothetical protein
VARRAIAAGCVAIVAAGAAAALALPGGARLCAPVRGFDAVTVDLSAADRGSDRATVCVDARCTRLARHARSVPFAVDASGPKLVAVTLLLERSGEPADVREAAIPLTTFAPNGPGCGTWWAGRVSSAELPPVAQRPRELFIAAH